MKKVICYLMMLCILLCGCSQGQKESDILYAFDKEEYPQFSTVLSSGLAYYAWDHYTLERNLMKYGNGEVKGLIAECVVSGDSINHVFADPYIEEYSTDTTSYVLTKIKIEKIYYKGSSVTLTEGDEAVLCEPFFYITDATPDMQKRFSVKQGVHLDDYNPVVKGTRYILFLNLFDTYSSIESPYPLPEGTVVVQPCERLYGVFPIGEKETVEKDLVCTNTNYWDMWESIMKLYLNYDGPLPLEAPLAYANKPADAITEW